MPGQSWNHGNTVELLRRFLRKLRKVLVVANIFLLLVTHCYQSMAKDGMDVFRGYRTIKWIYYALEVLYTVAHLIVSMELSSSSTFRHARTVFGTLGFETLLCTMVSYRAWLFINVAILIVALVCALGLEFLHIQPINIQTHEDGPVLELPFGLP